MRTGLAETDTYKQCLKKLLPGGRHSGSGTTSAQFAVLGTICKVRRLNYGYSDNPEWLGSYGENLASAERFLKQWESFIALMAYLELSASDKARVPDVFAVCVSLLLNGQMSSKCKGCESPDSVGSPNIYSSNSPSLDIHKRQAQRIDHVQA